MNTVERFENLMSFKPVDRLPMIEWAAYWDKTVERWHGEGLPAEKVTPEDVREFFGLDKYRQWWFMPRGESCPAPPHHGGPILETAEDYEKMKPHLYPKLSPEVKQIFQNWSAEQDKGEMVVWISLDGFFWYPRTLFGIEKHMFAFYDVPDLMHKMNQDLLDYNLYVLDEVCKICTPKFMTFGEDMSYNHGPMLSKDSFDEFLAPYYRKIVPELKQRGVLPLVDSDGDVTVLITWLKEVGIEGILPLERMAGVDVGQIRKDHPDFKMIGAFDKTIMHMGADAIRQEFERLLPTMKTGGFIPSVDYQTPPDVSIENYRTYLSLMEEYCRKAANA